MTILIPAARNWQRPRYVWRAIVTATGLPATGLAIGDFTIERSINDSAFGSTSVDASTFLEVAPGIYSVIGTQALPNNFRHGLVRGTRLNTTIVEGQLELDNTVYRGTVSVSGNVLTFPAGYTPQIGDVVWVYDGNAGIVNRRESIIAVNGQTATLRSEITGLANTDEVVVVLGDTGAGLADVAVNTNINQTISGIPGRVSTELADTFASLATRAQGEGLTTGQSQLAQALTGLTSRLNDASIAWSADGLSATLTYPNPAGGAPIVLNLTADAEGRLTNSSPV